MALRIFLFYLSVVWTPYGFYCLMFPEVLEGFAGVAATSVTASTEIRAMYGGLQVALGISALLAFFRVVYVDKVIFTQLVAVSGLAIARSLAALLSGDWSGYTIGALLFEWSTLVFCLMAMRSQQQMV